MKEMYFEFIETNGSAKHHNINLKSVFWHLYYFFGEHYNQSLINKIFKKHCNIVSLILTLKPWKIKI